MGRLRCWGGAVWELVWRWSLGNFARIGAHRRDVVLVHVGEKKMAQVEAVFLDQLENGRGVPAGVKQSGLARPFVPGQVAMDGHAVGGGGDLAQFAPEREIGRGGQPAVGDAFQLGRVHAEGRAERRQNSPARAVWPVSSSAFQSVRLRPAAAGGDGSVHQTRGTAFAEDVAQMIFQSHIMVHKLTNAGRNVQSGSETRGPVHAVSIQGSVGSHKFKTWDTCAPAGTPAASGKMGELACISIAYTVT